MKRILILLLCFCVFIFGLPSFSVVNADDEEDAFAGQDTLQEISLQTASQSITFSVSSSELRCGVPITFTLTPDNADISNCKFYLNAVYADVYGGDNLVTDPYHSQTFGAYQTQNTFELTFYASGTYYLVFYVMDTSTSPVSNCRKVTYFTLNDSNYPSVTEKAAQVVAECCKTCSTEYDKALWLHDWLMDNCTYDYTYTYCHAEGALCRGTGTCEAYHRGYEKLLDAAGIEHGRIVGNGHVWTAVKIDGEWTHIDVTWDDTTYSAFNHLYFGLNDELTHVAHSDHTGDENYPATTLENHYYIRSGYVTKWTDPYVDLIRKKVVGGETEFSVSITDGYPASMKDIYYTLGAYYLTKTLNTENLENCCNLSCSYADNSYNLEVTPHQYSFTGFEWDGYAAKAVYTCSNNSEHTVKYDAVITSEITDLPSPSDGKTGTKTYTASYDGHTDTKTESIISLDGSYTFSNFEWDGTAAKAVYTGSGETAKLTADVTYEVTTEPTCNTEGIITYTATFEGHTDTMQAAIQPTGHDYVFTGFIWEGYTAKALFTCTKDSAHTDAADAVITTSDTVTDEGYLIRNYIATYAGQSESKSEEMYLIGDMNGDGEVNDSDALWLLYNTFYSELYKIEQPGDMNKDGELNDADAIFLLYHTFYPDQYKIF